MIKRAFLGGGCYLRLRQLNKFFINRIYVYSKVKLATVIEGDMKAPFSIATTRGHREGHYSFPWIAPLYPWYVPYIAECLARSYQVPFLKSLVWLDLRLNQGLLDHGQTLYSLDHDNCIISEVVLHKVTLTHTHTHTHEHTHTLTSTHTHTHTHKRLT